jgi:pimeloyl-ACP methyl ester carboxylesterase
MNRRTWLALPTAAWLSGCAWWPREALVPMLVVRQPALAGRQAPVLVVMLPGAYSVPQDFIDEGFVAALRAQRFDVDVLLADAHLGYARNGTLLERLHDDALLPARRDGARRIWLVGISLGGFASLGLLMQHAELLDGILTIAPYVGRPELLKQVAAAGSAQAFAQHARPDGDFEAELWTWLGRSTPALRDKIHLYAGSQDRLIAGQRLFAASLAADHVLEVAGDHDWPAWKALWARWLMRAPWPRGSIEARLDHFDRCRRRSLCARSAAQT